MKRRLFIQRASAGLAGLGIASQVSAKEQGLTRGEKPLQSYVTREGNKISYFSEAIREPLKILLAADTHLWKNDERGDPFRPYSDRMAKAYNQTTHFQSGEATHPEESFERIVDLAVASEVDLLALPGDIFSWPSEAAIEWAHAKLEKSGVPYIYVAGNHDWHYEGMEGTLEVLRETWIKKRLLPLYQGKDPLMSVYDIKGLRFLAIDNSTYQISKEQLEFFRTQVAAGFPMVLLVHIPFYAPGKSVDFGCGHPDWGAATDQNHEIERRPKWPASGHTTTTMDFYREVFNAPNLLAVFAGHIHQASHELINGIPQFVADDNASGAYLDISFSPLSGRDKDLLNR